MMNRLQIFLLTIALLATTSLRAQNAAYLKTSFSDDSTIEVSFQVPVSELGLKGDQTFIITPFLKSETGKVLELEPVYIMGNRRYVMNKRFAKPITGKVLRSRDFKNKEYIYVEQIPFEPWMKEAKMEMKQELRGCPGCGTIMINTKQVPISKI